MSDTMLSSWFELEGGLPNDDQTYVIDPANGEIVYVAGLDLKSTDHDIPADGGAYFVRLEAQIMYPSSPPESGMCGLNVHFYYPDGSGNENVVLACGIEVNSLHDAEGFGDYPFFPFTQARVKTELFIAPTSGRFVIEAAQNTPESPMSVGGHIQIVKI